MKNRCKILGVILVLSAMITPHITQAQIINNGYMNVDWQFNAPIGNEFANVASGWGMNVEGGYYIIPKMSIGLFMSFHTNNKYIGEEVLHLSETESLFTDQQHSLYQLPFGAVMRWRFTEDRMFEPYIAAKLGAMYSRMESDTQVYTYYDTTWGFNVQPEVGVNIFPMPMKRVGIHIALYYNYSTNKSKVLTYDIDNYNNIGFHVGLSF